ncbi:hypothetical protein VSK90_00305 [Bacillus swezeyi]|uniref:hypothetical protein n=1 Tax=Bacillus swezeyi TaxID=1925020 RepID=UPI0039C76322
MKREKAAFFFHRGNEQKLFIFYIHNRFASQNDLERRTCHIENQITTKKSAGIPIRFIEASPEKSSITSV